VLFYLASRVVGLEDFNALFLRRRLSVRFDGVPATASWVWAAAYGKTNRVLSKPFALLNGVRSLLALDYVDDSGSTEKWVRHIGSRKIYTPKRKYTPVAPPTPRLLDLMRD
jgi:hypothetical protein